jgi:hypothetical protein
MTMEIRELFKSKQAKEPVKGQRDAITAFKNSVQTQIDKIDLLEKDPLATIATSNWFKAYDGGYRLHLGKKPLELDGARYWQVSNLSEARSMFESAITLASEDKEFQNAIRAAKQTDDKSGDDGAPKKRGRKSKPV